MNNSQLKYIDGQLVTESVSLTQIAEQVPTPFYCYSKAIIQNRIERCRSAFEPLGASIHYAVKANSNLAVLKLMADGGLGADIVSAGELKRVLAAGFDPAKVVFSGVGKSREELQLALQSGVGQINVESLPELRQLITLCERQQFRANVSVRVIPEVDAVTHRNITTGLRGSKFGLPIDQVGEALELIQQCEYTKLRGLAVHIGSQITDPEPFRLACERLRDWVKRYREQGYPVEHLDLGGGFGIDYGDGRYLGFSTVARVIEETLTGLEVQLAVEPGRSLVGDAGLLISRVVYRKTVEPVPFLVLDAGMNDLLRPALYQARHSLLSVIEPDGRLEECHVVGPVCESSDFFLRKEALPVIQEGELVAFTQAGAYAAVMASTYNGRSLIAEVMVDDQRFAIVREAVGVEQLMAYERVMDDD